MTEIETLTNEQRAWLNSHCDPLASEETALRVIDALTAENERLRAGVAKLNEIILAERLSQADQRVRALAAEARLDTATALLGQFTASSMRMFCSPNSVMGQLLVRVDTFLANQPGAPCSHCESPNGHCPHHRPDAWKEPAVPSFCKTCDDAQRFGSACSAHPQPAAPARIEADVEIESPPFKSAQQVAFEAQGCVRHNRFIGNIEADDADQEAWKCMARTESDTELARRGLK